MHQSLNKRDRSVSSTETNIMGSSGLVAGREPVAGPAVAEESCLVGKVIFGMQPYFDPTRRNM